MTLLKNRGTENDTYRTLFSVKKLRRVPLNMLFLWLTLWQPENRPIAIQGILNQHCSMDLRDSNSPGKYNFISENFKKLEILVIFQEILVDKRTAECKMAQNVSIEGSFFISVIRLVDGPSLGFPRKEGQIWHLREIYSRLACKNKKFEAKKSREKFKNFFWKKVNFCRKFSIFRVKKWHFWKFEVPKMTLTGHFFQ